MDGQAATEAFVEMETHRSTLVAMGLSPFWDLIGGSRLAACRDLEAPSRLQVSRPQRSLAIKGPLPLGDFWDSWYP